MNETKMTLTERNQKLYELRKKLDQKRMELAWIETEIMAVNSEYDRQNIDLFEEMFGEKNTLWDHLDRVTVNNWFLFVMNFTLKQLQQRVNNLIEEQEEDAYCGAWIYTKEDCFLTDENGEQEYVCDKHPELTERIFNDIGNVDYIYTVIQECVDEATEEHFMALQQELVWESF